MNATDYLVELRVPPGGAGATAAEGVAFIEHYVLPTLARCRELQAAGRIVAGGPMTGIIGLALIVRAESQQELDELIESLPLWGRAGTTVAALTTFDGREAAVRRKREKLQALAGSG